MKSDVVGVGGLYFKWHDQGKPSLGMWHLNQDLNDQKKPAI